MAPIKVGIMGLSKSGWARNAHFPYLKSSDKYQIVAICNSSVESAQAAITELELPVSTKAYGNPQDLANDSNVDMVVVSVRVDKHLAAATPILKAGKDIYVEWPLGKNLAEAQELLALKNANGVKNTIIGLQERQAPLCKLLKDLISSGRVGKPLSSTFTAQVAGVGGHAQDASNLYLIDRNTGGNMLTIGFGHIIQYVEAVLGQGFQQPPKTLLANQRPLTDVVDPQRKVVQSNVQKTSDDTLFLHGLLTTGVALSINLRGGFQFKNTPALDWRIYGEKGEIRITAPSSYVNLELPNTTVSIHDFASDSVEEIAIPTDELSKLPGPASSVGRVYEDFAAQKERVVTFEESLKTHELIDYIYKENGINV